MIKKKQYEFIFMYNSGIISLILKVKSPTFPISIVR